MSGNDEVDPMNRKYFKLEHGEKIKTKLFLDIPNYDREELRDYIEENYNASRLIWNIQYEINQIIGNNGCWYPIVTITVPRWTWVKKKYRKKGFASK